MRNKWNVGKLCVEEEMEGKILRWRGRDGGEDIEMEEKRWEGGDRGAPRNESKPGSKQWKQPRGWRSGNPFVIGRSPSLMRRLPTAVIIDAVLFLATYRNDAHR